MTDPGPASLPTPPAAPLVMLGSPAGIWRAAVVRTDAAGGGVPWPVEEDLAAAAAALAAGQVVALCFIDAPEVVLAARWQSRAAGPDTVHDALTDDGPRMLDTWARDARALLRLIERHRARCLVVDTAEAAGAPVALATALRGLAGTVPDGLHVSTAGLIDPVWLPLARAAAREHRAAWRLHEELQAHALPLLDADSAKGGATAGSSPPSDSALRGAALARLALLRKAEQQRPAVEADLQQAREHSRSLQADAEVARRAHDTALDAQRAEAHRLQAALIGLGERALSAETRLQAFVDALHQNQAGLEHAAHASQALQQEHLSLLDRSRAQADEASALRAAVQNLETAQAASQRDAAAAEARIQGLAQALAAAQTLHLQEAAAAEAQRLSMTQALADAHLLRQNEAAAVEARRQALAQALTDAQALRQRDLSEAETRRHELAQAMEQALAQASRDGLLAKQAIEARSAQAQAEIERLQTALDATRAEVQTLQQRLVDSAARLDADASAAELAQAALQDELQQHQQEHQRAAALLHSKLDLAQQTHRQAESEVQTLQQRLVDSAARLDADASAAELAQTALQDELHQHQQEHQRASTQLRSELDLAQRMHQQAEAELADERRALQQLRPQLQAATTEVHSLRQQIADGATLLDASARAAESAQAALQDRWQLQFQQQQGELALAQSELDLSQRMHQQAEVDLAGDRCELLQQLLRHRNLRDELQHQHRLLRMQDAAARNGLPLIVAEPALGAVVVGAEHGDAPHRHFDATVVDVPVGDAVLPHLAVRLVEHHGRPGLLLFCDDEGLPPLSDWSIDGTEAGRPYTSLVPSDGPGAARLSRLARADWVRVAALAAHLEAALRADPALAGGRWPGVAARLCRQLAALPARLRYDGIQVDAGPATGLLDVQLIDCLFGAQVLPAITLRWQPGPAAGLQWLLPAGETAAPLAAWPLGDDGRPEAAFTLPVGPSWGGSVGQQAWGRFSVHDRALLLGLLDALPAAAALVRPGDLADAGTAARLGASAADLHRQARRAVAAHELRRTLRSLVGRSLRRVGLRRG